MTKSGKKNAALTFKPYPLSRTYRIFGKRFQFSGPVTIFATLGFVAGYLDGVTLTKLNVYVTMSTGNILRGIIAMTHGNWPDAAFALCMVLFNTIIGGTVASFIFENFPSKYQSFMILSAIEIIACLICGVTMVYSLEAPLLQRQFSVLALAVSNGAMLFWSIKLGFSYAIHTVTLLKIAESGYKVIKSIMQGGQKLRGDVLTVLTMFTFFVVGSFSGILISHRIEFYSFFCLIPVHLFTMVHMHWYSSCMNLLEEEALIITSLTKQLSSSNLASNNSPHNCNKSDIAGKNSLTVARDETNNILHRRSNSPKNSSSYVSRVSQENSGKANSFSSTPTYDSHSIVSVSTLAQSKDSSFAASERETSQSQVRVVMPFQISQTLLPSMYKKESVVDYVDDVEGVDNTNNPTLFPEKGNNSQQPCGGNALFPIFGEVEVWPHERHESTAEDEVVDSDSSQRNHFCKGNSPHTDEGSGLFIVSSDSKV